MRMKGGDGYLTKIVIIASCILMFFGNGCGTLLLRCDTGKKANLHYYLEKGHDGEASTPVGSGC